VTVATWAFTWAAGYLPKDGASGSSPRRAPSLKLSNNTSASRA